MKTKTCPYCGKELSGEAVLCKFCHNLLIDEDGKMTSEGGLDDETKVFKKPDDDMTKRFVLPENAKNDGGSRRRDNSVIADAGAEDYFPDTDFDDYEDDSYDDEYEEDAARKRLFIITAVITIGVLIIVIAAILIGMRLFGKKGSNDNANTSGGAVPAATSAAEQQPQSDIVDEDYEDNNNQPAVTNPDDTNGQGEDSAAAVESAVQPPESGAADTSSQSDTDSSAVNFADPGDSSSSAENGDGSSSQAADSSQAEVDISDLENTVREAVAGKINGDITGSQFRTEENGYAYYYFFTDNGAHGYSVAYNTSTGEFVCEQNY